MLKLKYCTIIINFGGLKNDKCSIIKFLFFRDVPIDYDYEIFDAINGINVDSDKYPWLYRWLYSMNDYINLNDL